MKASRVVPIALLLAAIAPRGYFSLAIAAGAPGAPDATPVLVNTCIITSNVKRLVAFYEIVLQTKAKTTGSDYAEFPSDKGGLAIFSSDAQEQYIPNSAKSGKNQSVILEFRVADVDVEYRRLQSVVKTWVKPPTTQPWGTRSICFRDPDGNLVDFFTPPRTS